MKKLLSTVLILACLCMLFACNAAEADPIDKFSAKVDSADLTKATFTTEYTTELGTLQGSYEVAYNEDETATVSYSYEKWNALDNPEPKSTVTGTVTRNADGTFEPDSDIQGVPGESFKLKVSALKGDSSVKIDGDVLTAKITASNVKAVLGIESLPTGMTSADLEITVSGSSVKSVKLTFTDGTNTAVITCSYR